MAEVKLRGQSARDGPEGRASSPLALRDTQPELLSDALDGAPVWLGVAPGHLPPEPLEQFRLLCPRVWASWRCPHGGSLLVVAVLLVCAEMLQSPFIA